MSRNTEHDLSDSDMAACQHSADKLLEMLREHCPSPDHAFVILHLARKGVVAAGMPAYHDAATPDEICESADEWQAKRDAALAIASGASA